MQKIIAANGSTCLVPVAAATAALVERTHGPCVRVAASELPEVPRRDHAHAAVAVAVAVEQDGYHYCQYAQLHREDGG